MDILDPTWRLEQTDKVLPRFVPPSILIHERPIISYITERALPILALTWIDIVLPPVTEPDTERADPISADFATIMLPSIVKSSFNDTSL
jgi:hypothetical protein